MRLIESTKATERARGVQELAEMLREDAAGGRSTLAASIHGSVWESVLSWTAGILIKEAQSFVNKHGDEWPRASQAGERLGARIQTQYSTPVRHIWVAAMPHLPARLARFVVKHITDSLGADPCLEPVFGHDYAKVLCAWAAHEPHVYNCKDSRARAIVDLCIRSLARFGGGAAESQASADSAHAHAVQPGDVELAATLLAVVAAATPARLAGIGDAVLGFCAEYCRHHVRENPCVATVLDTANTVYLARAEAEMARDPGRIRSLLRAALQLWPTRTRHLKRAALYTVRILSRLVAHQAAEAGGGDGEARALLELTLKTVTAGPWDRHKFMALPRELLAVFPLAHRAQRSDAAAVVGPLRLFAPVHAVVGPLQLAFFDTVAHLAMLLTRLAARGSEDIAAAAAAAAPHRKKRRRQQQQQQQAAPTSLARLLAEASASDQPAQACGAAQALWYAATVYGDALGGEQCAELLDGVRDAVRGGDMRQRGGPAAWLLGAVRALLPRAPGPAAADAVWPHAVAGIEAGVCGAAGLALDLLRRAQRPTAAATHALCRQAAAALAARAAPHDADSAQLLLFLAQYVRPPDEALARTAAQAIVRLCRDAAQQRWPAGLFADVLARVLGVADGAGPRAARAVLGPDWRAELRLTHVLHALAVLADCPATCRSLLAHHMAPPAGAAAPAPPAELAAAASSISPAQWHAVCAQLLRFVDHAALPEHGPAAGSAIPYVAVALWLISDR
ncbi:hypothetical protein H4R18_001053, partial [Coemansia javaensis]